jgi:hypothetical protein
VARPSRNHARNSQNQEDAAVKVLLPPEEEVCLHPGLEAENNRSFIEKFLTSAGNSESKIRREAERHSS